MRQVLRWKNMSLLLAALLVFGFSVVGCERNAVSKDDFTPTETIDFMLQQGWENLKAGDPEAAVDRFTAAANANATTLEAYLGLGYAYALMNQPSVAQNNFGNVLALGPVLGNEYPPDHPIYAETYAGMSAAFLAAGEYEDAVTNAKLGEAIWEKKPASQQVHRFLDFDLTDLRLIEAEAQYGAENYYETMLILDQVTGNFISSTSSIVQITAERDAVTVLQTTATDGIANVTLSHGNLIYPQSAAINSLDYAIVDFTVAGSGIQIQGTPIPARGDSVDVDYLYATDYGLFLSAMRDKLDELSQ